MPIEHDDIVYVQSDQNVDGIKTFEETPLVLGEITQSKNVVTVEYLSSILGVSIDPNAIKFMSMVVDVVDVLPSPIPAEGSVYVSTADNKVYTVYGGSWVATTPDNFTATVSMSDGAMWFYYNDVWHSISANDPSLYPVEESFILTSTDIENKSITLLNAPVQGIVDVDVVGAHELFKGTDFNLIDDGSGSFKKISWAGKDLDGRISAGDRVSVQYYIFQTPEGVEEGEQPVSSIPALDDLTNVNISSPQAGQILQYTSLGVWANATPSSSGTGDVVGPSSSVDNQLVVFSGITGKIIKSSNTLVSDLATSTHNHNSEYLSLTNTTEYTPTADYHPATKKYVDDNAGVGGGTGDMLKSVYDSDDDGKVSSAVTADSIPWSGVTNPPSTYTPSAHSHSDATQSVSGFLSTTDKAKLDGIATGANNYTLPIASADTLGGIKVGSGLSITDGVLATTGGGGLTEEQVKVIAKKQALLFG